jgi:hypothetical protein
VSLTSHYFFGQHLIPLPDFTRYEYHESDREENWMSYESVVYTMIFLEKLIPRSELKE